MKFAPALGVLILAIATAPYADAANTWLQPGTKVETVGGGCTLNFVFTDAENTYIGTAGHCVVRVGERMSTPGHGEWGTAVVDIDGTTDFALLLVDPAKVAAVRPAVQHWGGPSGVIAAPETAAGDLLAIYGYGAVLEYTEPTRAKQGMLVYDNSADYAANTWAVFGDSGGPVLHKDTGKALGIISRFNLPASSDIGPTIPHILAQLEQRGYYLQLETAPTTGALI